MEYSDILNIPPYSMKKEEKEALLTEELLELTEFHRKNCCAYKNMTDCTGYQKNNIHSYYDLPFLPVRLFKERDLKSIPDEQVFKVMTSSGTTGQAVSKIYLDRTTASDQQKTLVKIVSEFMGSARLPMIIVDCPSVVKNRQMFSARGAGILGFSIFGAKKIYALKDNMELDTEALEEFLEMYKGKKILLFGFTFMVWQHFYHKLSEMKKQGKSFDLSNGILIHGGGWKKLIRNFITIFTQFVDFIRFMIIMAWWNRPDVSICSVNMGIYMHLFFQIFLQGKKTIFLSVTMEKQVLFR